MPLFGGRSLLIGAGHSFVPDVVFPCSPPPPHTHSHVISTPPRCRFLSRFASTSVQAPVWEWWAHVCICRAGQAGAVKADSPLQIPFTPAAPSPGPERGGGGQAISGLRTLETRPENRRAHQLGLACYLSSILSRGFQTANGGVSPPMNNYLPFTRCLTKPAGAAELHVVSPLKTHIGPSCLWAPAAVTHVTREQTQVCPGSRQFRLGGRGLCFSYSGLSCTQPPPPPPRNV